MCTILFKITNLDVLRVPRVHLAHLSYHNKNWPFVQAVSTSHCEYQMVECESGRVAQKWSSASRICEYIVLNINIFNVKYHAIIEIVESGRFELTKK